MMLNTNRLLVALIMGFAMSPFVQAQLKAFKPGDVIKSSEINENFEYLEEQIGSAGDAASAQCSATQDGSNVVISCTDGSSAVLAGAGTVVTYQQGTVGEIDPSVLNTGDVVLYDGADVALGIVDTINEQARDRDGNYPASYYSIKVDLDSGATKSLGYMQNTALGTLNLRLSSAYFRYQSEDCSGQPLVNYGTDPGITSLDGQQYFIRDDSRSYSVLVKSLRTSINYLNDAQFECEMVTSQLNSAYMMVPVTVPASLLEPAYPVRVEQLP